MLMAPAAKPSTRCRAVRREYPVEDDGTVFVAGEGSVSGTRRRHQRHDERLEAGEIYTGKVVKTTNFGAFVELTPGRDGLVHISRLAPGKQRVERVEDVVSEGDRIKVRVLEIDKQNRISLEKLEG